MMSIETVTEQLRAYARKITHEPGTSAWKRELARYALRLRRRQHVYIVPGVAVGRGRGGRDSMMDEYQQAFDGVYRAVCRFLKKNPQIKAQAIAADDGTIRGSSGAAKIVADAMDAYNWLPDGDFAKRPRTFVEIVHNALYRETEE